MLKSFFLSERKLVYAMLRVKLAHMKDVSDLWNNMLFAMQKRRVRASMHSMISLELH